LTERRYTDDEIREIVELVGATVLVANRVRLPPWARLREQQMEHIASRHLVSGIS
jgi:hypothetical protein